MNGSSTPVATAEFSAQARSRAVQTSNWRYQCCFPRRGVWGLVNRPRLQVVGRCPLHFGGVRTVTAPRLDRAIRVSTRTLRPIRTIENLLVVTYGSFRKLLKPSGRVQIVRILGLLRSSGPAQPGQYQRNYGTKYGTEPFRSRCLRLYEAAIPSQGLGASAGTASLTPTMQLR